MASLARTFQEPTEIPVKNTFVHFPTMVADADASSRRRCRSAPPAASHPALEDSVPRNRSDSTDDAESCCPTIERTLTGSTVDTSCEVLSRAGNSDVADADSVAPICSHETLVVQSTDAKWTTSIAWTVDAERLGGSQHKVPSPEFQVALPGWGWASFQICLYASNRPGVLSFQEADGQGRAELKCLDGLPPGAGGMAHRVTVGSQPSRGWVTHDFSRVPQRSERRLNFAAAVDASSRTLTVVVTFAPAALA